MATEFVPQLCGDPACRNADCQPRRYREGDDPIWEATVRGELDDPPDEADYYDGDD